MSSVLKQHDAVQEVYIKKLKLEAEGTPVTVTFERDYNEKSGIVSFEVKNTFFPDIRFEFTNMFDAIRDKQLKNKLLFAAQTNQSRVLIEALDYKLQEYADEYDTDFMSSVSNDVKDTIERELKKAIAKATGVDKTALTSASVFRKDIPMDELGFVEMIMSIEEMLSIEFDDDNLEGDISYGRLLKQVVQMKIEN
jgi:acyl carrier protein